MVGALATEAFNLARTGIVRLFARRGADEEARAEAQLDSDQKLPPRLFDNGADLGDVISGLNRPGISLRKLCEPHAPHAPRRPAELSTRRRVHQLA